MPPDLRTPRRREVRRVQRTRRRGTGRRSPRGSCRSWSAPSGRPTTPTSSCERSSPRESNCPSPEFRCVTGTNQCVFRFHAPSDLCCQSGERSRGPTLNNESEHHGKVQQVIRKATQKLWALGMVCLNECVLLLNAALIL